MKALIFTLLLVSSLYAKKIKVSVSSYQIEGGKNVSQYLNKIEKEIQLASQNRSNFILFPELISLDLFEVTPKDIKKNIQKSIDQTAILEQRFSQLAQRYKINIIGPSHFVQNKNSILNRAYIIRKDGTLYYQDKIYPTPWEKKYDISGGEHKVRLFNFEGVRFVVLICHDVEFPNLSVMLKKLRPEIIFVPSQTDTFKGRNRVIYTSKARAIEQMSYVFVAGNSGIPKAKWHSYQGGSHLFTPQNKYFSKNTSKSFPGTTQIKHFQIDLKILKQSRNDTNQVFPIRDIIKQ